MGVTVRVIVTVRGEMTMEWIINGIVLDHEDDGIGLVRGGSSCCG